MLNYDAYPAWKAIDEEIARIFKARLDVPPHEPGVSLVPVMLGRLVREQVITAEDALAIQQKASDPYDEARASVDEALADGILERLKKIS